jgi:hypothetical protein
MPTLSGLIHRTAPEAEVQVIQFTSWGVYLIAIAGLCIYSWKSKKIGERQIGLAVVVSLFVVPYLHYHDLTSLLIPIFCLIRVLDGRNFLETRNLALLPLVVSFMLLFGSLNPALKYNVPYVAMILLILLISYPEKIFLEKVEK